MLAPLFALALMIAPMETPTMQHARGTFDVVMTPVAPGPAAAPDMPGRMVIAKTYHGDIDGSGAGEMLATMADGGSGAYVALERVTGVVGGRSGAFTLVHRGLLDRGAHELSITVVPGSGAGELSGLSGVYHLTIEGGVHRYDLEYSLPTS